MTQPDHPTTPSPDLDLDPGPIPVRGELWHRIEIDHEVYRAIIQHGLHGDFPECAPAPPAAARPVLRPGQQHARRAALRCT